MEINYITITTFLSEKPYKKGEYVTDTGRGGSGLTGGRGGAIFMSDRIIIHTGAVYDLLMTSGGWPVTYRYSQGWFMIYGAGCLL